MNTIATGIIIFFVVAVVTWLQIASWKKPVVFDDGSLVLRYPLLIAVVGYFGIGFGISVGFIAISRIIPSTGVEFVPFLVLGFALISLPLVLLQRNVKITVSDKKIYYCGITKKIREMGWNEIQKVTFRMWSSELILESEKSRILISSMMKGYKSFVEQIKQKLEPALYEKAVNQSDRTTGIF